MQTSKQQILQTLERETRATARQISRALYMTPANVRYHLNELLAAGLVTVVGRADDGGRGRPARVFALAPNAQRNNLPRLASALLHAIQSHPAAQEILTDSIPHLAGVTTDKGHWLQRLNAAIQQLDEQGYQARWEASPSGPRVILGHCPYLALLDEHPVLCELDRLVLEHLTGARWEQTACRAPGPGGAPRCVFNRRSGR